MRRMAFWTLIALGGLLVAAALFVVAVNLAIIHKASPFIVQDARSCSLGSGRHRPGSEYLCERYSLPHACGSPGHRPSSLPIRQGKDVAPFRG